jgi:SAM-dependent methyltransferase
VRVTVHGGTKPAAPTAWEKQAAWYDQYQGHEGDDFYQRLILPAVLRQLAVIPGRRVLDVGCGQGVLGRALAERQIASLGIDASPSLIEAAQRRSGPLEQYRLGDVRTLETVLVNEHFAAASAVLCLQDLDPLEPVFAGVAEAVEPGGRFVMVMTHPCFRIPKRSGWGWDERDGLQFRRVEAYQSPLRLPIVTHPGQPTDGASTSSFHRPIAMYLNALGASGFGVVACEELCSHRRGTRGPRFLAEDRAAKEIPQFMVLTALRR